MAIIRARYPGRCCHCSVRFKAGTQVDFRGLRRAYHLQCTPENRAAQPSLLPERRDVRVPYREEE